MPAHHGKACSGSPSGWRAAPLPLSPRCGHPLSQQPSPLRVDPIKPKPFQRLQPNSRSLKRSHISMSNICLGGSETVCFGVVRVQSSAASSTHVSLPFTAYSTPSTSPANRFVSVGPRDPSFVNIPQQTQVGAFDFSVCLQPLLLLLQCPLTCPRGAAALPLSLHPHGLSNYSEMSLAVCLLCCFILFSFFFFPFWACVIITLLL